MSKDPIHNRFHMEELTFALPYAFHENFILPLSHDEVVHGKAPDQTLVFAFNFTSIPRMNYRIGAPWPGFYQELINSDEACYGGSNIGLDCGVKADPTPWHSPIP